MFSRASPLIRTASRSVAAPSLARSAASFRGMSTIAEALTANDASKLSCYSEIDYAINEDAPVYEAIQKMSAYDIGCLVTTDSKGNLSGVISERDYITKIALLGRTSKDTKVREIATMSSKLITAKTDDSIEACMEKMLQGGIRHLPLVNTGGELKGMISIKDLVKTAVSEKDETIKVLSDFALGKGGHFGSE